MYIILIMCTNKIINYTKYIVCNEIFKQICSKCHPEDKFNCIYKYKLQLI